MSCTTYISEEEVKQLIAGEEPDFTELFEKIENIAVRERWLVCRYLEPKKWYRRSRNFWYSILVPINGTEYQIINFPPKDEEGKGVRWVPRQVALAYLAGAINGW